MIKTTPLENGCYYHVYNRGNNSELIFKEPTNYTYFLGLIKKYIIPIADIYAYCLLNNHFHLLIRIKEDQTLAVERCFSNLFSTYSKAFNKKYNRTGKLFEERFKRKKIDDDAYFGELICYIHINPQKHKFLKDFRTYQYSSYKAFSSDSPTLIKRAEVLDWFGSKHSFEACHIVKQHAIEEYAILED